MNDDNLIIVIVVAITVLIILSMSVILLFVTSKRKKMLMMFEKEDLLRSQMEIQENMMIHIGREIHDNIGQTLSVAKLYLGSPELTDHPDSGNKIRATNELIGKAIEDLRNLSHSFNTDSLETIGIQKALANECDRITRTGKLICKLNSQGTSFRLESRKEIILFRMCQELLNNVIKHANATQISLELKWEGPILELIIQDNGSGFDSDKGKSQGHGLMNLIRRAQLLGAEFTLNSKPGMGTTASIRISE